MLQIRQVHIVGKTEGKSHPDIKHKFLPQAPNETFQNDSN